MSATSLAPADLSPELQADVRRLILSLADTKRLLGIRYSDWLLGAPSIEAGIAASGMAQDEWGHARLLYALLKDFDEDPKPVEYDRAPAEYASCDTLDAPAEDWADVVALMAVVDSALTVLLQAFAEGSYEPASGRAGKMIAEEDFHGDMASAWLRRLGSASPEARSRIAEACSTRLPRTLAWMAPDDEVARRLYDAGVLPSADEMVRRFVDARGAALGAVGVAIPEPDRSGWDAERGRGPGHPGLEAVERARGDLNRELFVE
ncbi:MAG: phenylacetate-CoA oxygenase subunit PaaI [Gemmatimonadetes bacterium]|nr:phenylacetate-CoA oxygenase subunit PaaI [Gemmatimonadota bacterium]